MHRQGFVPGCWKTLFVGMALFVVACGGSERPGDDVPQDVAFDGVAPGDATGDAADVVADSGSKDVPDGSDATSADLPVDSTQAERDRLFSGIREECRPANLGCRTDDQCGGGEKCVGTGCVGAVEPENLDFDRLYVMTRLAVPTAGSGSFDYNGDGEPDNMLATAIAAYPGGLDLVNDTLDRYVGSGMYTYAVAFRDVPTDACGALRVAVLPATGDVDHDGLPDGDGTLQLLKEGFREDGHGPIAQLNTSAIDGDLVLSGPGASLTMQLPLPDGDVLDVPVEGLRVRATVALVESQTAFREDTMNAEVGGYVRMSSLVDAINERAGSCACAGLTPGATVAELVLEDTLTAQCIETIDDSACDDLTDGKVCDNLSATCTALMVMATMLDVATGDTTDGEGQPVNDAMSIGLYARIAPAALAEPPVPPDFLAVNDSYQVIPEADVTWVSVAIRIGVLLNDFYDATVSPVIVGVTQGAKGGTAAIGSDATFVLYTAPAGFYGIDDFTYTISDGGGNTSEATVQVRTSTFNPLPCDASDTDLCTQRAYHDATCIDGNAAITTGELESAISDCLVLDAPVLAMSSECARATRCLEACRVGLTCRQTAEYDEAVAVLEAGGDVDAHMPCGALIARQMDECGECAPGTYGPDCLPCEGYDSGEVCGGIGTCDDGTAGDGTCVCGEGLAWFDGGCYDVDECNADVPIPVCGPDATCVNYVATTEHPGGYGCFCPDDGVFEPASRNCVTPSDPCSPNPCLQVQWSPGHACNVDEADPAGYTCDCEEGYAWQGTFEACTNPDNACEPDLCRRDPHAGEGCEGLGEGEGYMCFCTPEDEYFWDQDTLQCIDPCDSLDCNADPNSTGECIVPSMIGDPECVCNDPFHWSYPYGICWNWDAPCDADPCGTFDGGIGGSCETTGGSDFTCDCEVGYIWSDDGLCLPDLPGA